MIQTVQVLLLASAVFAFFLLFGSLVMETETQLRGVDWLGASRRAAAALERILSDAPSTRERAKETGTRGEGGDDTLVIDAAAEQAVFDELEALRAAGAHFRVVSEERGEVDFGAGPDGFPLVVVDPIDGSLNAKRRMSHHALSVAVADGPTLADVGFAYVYDFGPGEEWVAWCGEGATLDGLPIATAAGERRSDDGRLLELVGIESADPRWIAQAADALVATAHRIRAFGTIAVSLCQVADARLDAMATIKGCRAVDAAAAQLIVREAGGLVASCQPDVLGVLRDPGASPEAVREAAAAGLRTAPLDLESRASLIAARTPGGLAQVSAVPQRRS